MREKIVRRVAGIFVLISITLAWLVNHQWLWFTAFVGINLVSKKKKKLIADHRHSLLINALCCG